jgi:hypothetical protein
MTAPENDDISTAELNRLYQDAWDEPALSDEEVDALIEEFNDSF